jgi:hypothetical protein
VSEIKVQNTSPIGEFAHFGKRENLMDRGNRLLIEPNDPCPILVEPCPILVLYRRGDDWVVDLLPSMLSTVHQLSILRATGEPASREDTASDKRKWTRMHLKYKVKDIIKIQGFRLSERVDPN